MPTKLKSLKKNKGETIPLPRLGENIEGIVEATERNSIYIDLGPQGVGVIYGREFYRAKDTLKKLNPGDKISAKVIVLENDEGYRELSISEALRESIWKELAEKRDKAEAFDVRVEKANKGGLICYVKNIPAFLPVSYLSPEHYPKIKNGDTNQIARVLQKFVSQTLKVKIIDLDPKKDKLILAEKQEDEKETEIKYNIGDIVEGKVTGLTDFGAFVSLDKNTEGLLYPSKEKEAELKIGKKVRAKISKIENNRIYLSLEHE